MDNNKCSNNMDVKCSNYNVLELVNKSVTATPQAVAIEHNDGFLDYQTLERRTNHIAHQLIDAGLTKGQVVALLLTDPLDHIIALIGVMKAGGIFSPLDARDPIQRLHKLTDIIAPAWWITNGEMLPTVADIVPPNTDTRILLTDSETHELNLEGIEPSCLHYLSDNTSIEKTTVVLAPDDPCYIFFTSGSSGNPKPILGRIKSLAHFIQWETGEFSLDEQCRASQLTAPTFDAFLRDLFVPLTCGGTLCLPPSPANQLSPHALVSWLNDANITLVHTVPSLFRTLLQEGLTSQHFSALQLMLMAGEPVLPSDAQHWHQVFAERIQLVNLYGSTETTLIKCFHAIRADDLERGFIPIGKPIDGAQAILLDEQLQICSRGQVGELYLRSPYFTLGYYQQPERTAEVFVPNPLTDDPNDLVYRTGDLAVMLDDGALRFLGRKDHQVKIRGVRVELEEIENALLQHSEIHHVAVVTHTDNHEISYLQAYYISGTELVDEELRAFLGQQLSASMIPTVFTSLEEMPLTPSGKINRKALAAVQEKPQKQQSGYVASTTPTQAKLAEIWQEVLNVKSVGIHDNFFALGGHSLRALLTTSRIRKNFDIELPPVALFNAPTIAELAKYLDTQSNKTGMPPQKLSSISPIARDKDIPLSFAQQRLWFLDQLIPENPFYNIPTAVRLHGQLGACALHQSLNAVAERHEIMRTVFPDRDGEPRQVIRQQQTVQLPIVDLSALPDVNREAELLRLVSAEAQLPFQLSNGPLIRASLIHLDTDHHVALLNMHHIISDDWSMSVLIQELTELYDAFVRGLNNPLSRLPIQYADFAYWQHTTLKGERLDQQMSYWREQLAGSPDHLELSTDRPRPPVQSYRGSTYPCQLSPALTEQLNKLSQTHNVTLFMTLMAAFQLLLSRYSGQRDICVGTPVVNRQHTELESLIGFFVNTLVIRTRLANCPKFTAVLEQVRETTLNAYAHQDLPFEQLVDELQILRDLRYAPVFQVLLDLQNAPPPNLKTTGLQFQPLTVPNRTVKFDLELHMVETPEGLKGRWVYATDLFNADTIARWSQSFIQLLEQLVEQPDIRLSELQWLSDGERRQLLNDWSAAAAAYPAALTLQQRFEQQVLRTPHATAAVYDKQSLSYAELNCRANQLAHYLRARGVAADTLVGLCVQRSLDMVVAILGILKAGGAYVPLDPDVPQERLQFILNDTHAPILLTQQSLQKTLPDAGTTIIYIDNQWDDIAQLPQSNLAPISLPSHLAYVIYTSGSTGRPKGVLSTHANVTRLFDATAGQFDFTQDDIWTLLHSYAFDFSVWELWGALLFGGQLIIVPWEASRDPQAFYALLKTHRVTILNQTPSAFRQLLACEHFTNDDAELAVRHIVFGGEALDLQHLQPWYTRYADQTQLANMYGITETTVHVTHCPLHSGALNSHHMGKSPIGQKIADLQTYILDEHLSPVPIGVPGELYVGGAGLARGYLNRAALSAERFIPHPFSTQPGARLYKTGDRVRYLSDGSLDYLGRLDAQVKLRGFRIEPREIESALRQHSAVEDAVVVLREDQPGNQQLTAYWVRNVKADSPQPADLRRFLHNRLPEYMIPAAYVALETLPLTPNGKLDHKALPTPDVPNAGQEYLPPRTQTETTLAQIWSDTLDADRVGSRDNFFELGGHSLLATQVVARIRKAFEIELPISTLFEHNTLESLAVQIDSARDSAKGLFAPPINPVSRELDLPLSFAQQRLWFLDQLSPENPFYNIPTAVRLRGSLDHYALHETFNTVVHRHEVLRTVFINEGGEPRQIVKKHVTVNLPVINLCDLPEKEREQLVHQLAFAEAQTPFDLSCGPLLRVRLLCLAPQEHVVLFNMHHIVSDGWSSGLLVAELAILYNAYAQGLANPLQPLTIQYADFAYWQRQWLQGEALQQQLNYWRDQLADAPKLLQIPTDYPRPQQQNFRGERYNFQIPADLTEQLNRLSRANGATLFMTLMAVFQVMLSKFSGQSDICVGTPIANRAHKELETLIGFFTNTLVIRTQLDSNPGFCDFLAKVRTTTLEAYTHQDLPFEQLVDALQVSRDMRHTPIFQVLFALQNAPRQKMHSNELQLEPVDVTSKTTRFDLIFDLTETPSGLLNGFCQYSTDLFHSKTIKRFVSAFMQLLTQVVAKPDIRLCELEVLNPAERRQLLTNWTNTQTPYPDEHTIHQLFEAQAAQHPHAPALVLDETSMSYAQLNARANQLAHYLRQQGVAADTLVGLCMDRSLDMLIAVLGILKAGGAYMPLDPDAPQERLMTLLRDARVKVLLTQSRQQDVLPDLTTRVLNQLSYQELVLDTQGDQLRGYPQTNPDNRVTPHNLAYVVYTSGSTGRPKGVTISHRAVSRLVFNDFAEFGPDRPVLCAASIAFDAATFELWGALLHGATVVLYPERIPTTTALRAYLAAHPVHSAWLTASLFNNLVETDAQCLAGIEQLLIGGEALSPRYVKQAYNELPKLRLINGYGPTEATTFSCTYTIPRDIDAALTIPIGRAIANTDTYVLDPYFNPVPVGTPGELFVGGPGLARGYLNLPGLTTTRFIPHPFTDEPGARLYKTGDQVRYLADGNIEFLGRIDHQVKLRGFRIEPGEIETALLQHPAVKESVVLLRQDHTGNHNLAAYLVLDPGIKTADPKEFKTFLQPSLPEYMIPVSFTALETMPLNRNGKLERNALPHPDMLGSDQEYMAPQTPTEQTLARLWADVLAAERIGLQDNFFELGGHSLLVTQVISRIRQSFAIDVPISALFEHVTLTALASYVDATQRTSQGVIAPPITAVPRDATLPLSFAQQRLWFLDQLIPNNPFYNIPIAMRLHGPLNINALHKTLSALVDRHEVFRTLFSSQGGQPQQLIQEHIKTCLPVCDISALPELSRKTQLKKLVNNEAQIAFDLGRGPLIRSSLIRIDHEHHVVALTMHHIVSDAWSMGILVQELTQLYNAFTEGKVNPLPPLAIQYADYAHWQLQWLQNETLDRQLEYWQENLQGAPELLTLPTDYPRPQVQSYRGSSLPLQLSATLTEQLNEFSRLHSATLFMTLMTIFQMLLARHSNQTDVCVGIPIANRHYAELEPLVGFFVNTLVIRTRLHGNPSVGELLSQVRDTTLGAYAHQDLPFEQLIDSLQISRNMEHSPVFQVMLSLQNTPQSNLHASNLRLQPINTSNRTVKFDIELQLNETGDGVTGTWHYATDLFHAETIEHWSRAFFHLLEQVVATPNARLSELTILDDRQRRQLLVDWNNTAVPYPTEPCLHQLFESQVNRTPDALAIVFEEHSLTYAQLNDRANQLAHYLRAQGVGSDTRVALCLERSPEMVIGLYGILKAGGAYVPLDPDYPAERISFILADTAAALILTQQRLNKVLNNHSAARFYLDSDWQHIAHYPKTNPVKITSTANLAYVIYTSGSTGQPKGVAVAHRGVCDRMRWTQERYPLNAQDSVLLKTPFSFDVSVCEFFWPLIAGARLVITQPEGHKDPVYLSRVIDQHQISVVHFVPSMLQAFLDQLTGESGRSLTRIICSGEALALDLQQRCLTQLNTELHNLYGPTETSIHVTAWECQFEAPYNSVPMGRPLANTDVYVLDRYFNPVPVGVPGELYIGGTGVARGYLNRPTLTAQSFVPHPYSDDPGMRLYKTGDLVRYLPDGNLEYLGRLDHQVKLRGFRIELGEIEAALRQHPTINEAAVLLREDKPGQQRLAAYIAWQSETTTAETHALKRFLQNHLPDYMIPANYITIAAMPLTQSGKLDRKALPAPEMECSHQAYVAPRTPAEEMLAGIWKDVLKIERVGIYDNFFELGGHSLLATQVISRIRQSFNSELAISTVFQQPTLAGLSSQIINAQSCEQSPVAPPITPVARDQQLPLSYAQQRLWFLDQLIPDNPFYNVPVAVRLRGPLHIFALREAFNTVVARHESLRTVFHNQNGQPQLVIKTYQYLNLPLVDVSDLCADDAEAVTIGIAASEAQTPFNLAQGPLLRTTLIRLETNHHVVMLNMHHIVSDAWSLGVLIQELASLYGALSQGLPNPLPPLTIQYADFAHWQRQWLQGEKLARQSGYWRNQLSNAPQRLELPADQPRQPVQKYRGATQSLQLTTALSQQLEQLSRHQDSTLFMTLMATFQIMVAKLSDQTDICIGTPIANRQHAELEPLIGFFTNTLVIRTHLDNNPAFSDILAQVRQKTLGAYAHQDLPFEQLVEELNVARDMSHSPLFQVLFTLHNTPWPSIEEAQLQLQSINAPNCTAKFDLELHLVQTSEGLQGNWQYDSDLYEPATLIRWTQMFIQLLEQIVARPNAYFSELDILNKNERQQQLIDWNATFASCPAKPGIHQLIETQTAHTPGNTAVVYEEQSLTYAELNTRANQLAHYLRAQGVGPDILVGLCVERSLEMLVALLGILKAGGAYVPLDPKYPQERLTFILNDTNTPLVVTQQSLSDRFSRDDTLFVKLDTQWQDIARYPQDNLSPVANTNLAYVLYTSGSTGMPKGVQVQHHSVINFLHAMQTALSLQTSDTLLAVTPLTFDISVLELFLPLAAGAQVVVVSKTCAADAHQLAAALADHHATIMQATPATWQSLVYSHWIPSRPITILCGGEALTSPLAESLSSHANSLWNLYGPTESTIWSTIAKIDSDVPAAIPIGQPIFNTETYVLDRHLNPVPVGVSGELYIGGNGLARGYLHQAGLTAERFIPHPFSSKPGARLYRTGDIARYGRDGNLEYVGRRDHQVKLRGFRIELGEIEAVLREHSDVREAAVLLREDVPGDKCLTAYLLAKQHTQIPDDNALRTFLHSRLPEYMLPAHFIALDKLPLTPNGKLDRKSLPIPDQQNATYTYVAPRNLTEQALAEIWSTVLNVEQVGIHDNFFELGGHSLLATQVMARLRSVFNIELPVKTLFQHSALAALATEVMAAQQSSRGLYAPPIVSVPRHQTDELPLSFAQQRLWFLDQLIPDNPFYNIPVAMRLRGPLDTKALYSSLNTVVSRHESLRTVFLSKEGLPRQVIQTRLIVDLPVIDLSALGQSNANTVMLNLAALDARSPFNLTHGPLMRVCLIRLGNDHHVALLNMHHVISDGWSMNVLVQELASLYGAISQGLPNPLPRMNIQYADFSQWQRQWLQDGVVDIQLSYWRNKLSDAPELLELPTDRPRPTVQRYQGASQLFDLSDTLSDQLNLLSRSQGATLFMTLMAAFQVLLSKLSNQQDICVGTPIANRHHAELEPLIGFFVNTLVIRTRLNADPTFNDILTQVRATTLDAFGHQDLPFEQLVDELNVSRDMGHTPLFQVALALQNAPRPTSLTSTLQLQVVETPASVARFDIELQLVETREGIKGAWHYATDLFDRATIAQWAQSFVRLLEQIAARPTTRLSELEVIDDSQRRQLLIEHNNTTRPYPAELGAHQLFEAQVERTPDAVAAAFEGHTLSYAELNARANQLAQYLRTHGVKPDTLVALFIERSMEMLVGVLGILKAGGAYVPLDPDVPQNRLRMVLEDIQTPLLVTQHSLSETLSDTGVATIYLDSEWHKIAAYGVDNVVNLSLPDNLAYVLYTSGSTGKPKGVSIAHRGLSNYLSWCLTSYEPQVSQGTLLYSSLAFDFTITSLFSSLLTGNTVHIIRDNSLEALNEAMNTVSDLSLLKLTPSHLTGLSPNLSEEHLPRLTHKLILGGEGLYAEHLQSWLQKAPGSTLINEYGPTEAVVGCATYTFNDVDQLPGAIPIGKPIQNMQLYVLDRHLNPVPQGASGELYIGGVGLARGYLKQPGLTGEKFIPHPFSQTPGTRLYKTGDRVRYLADGNLQFLGRIDHQVKLRGFRIELGEIETALRQHPTVSEAVVVLREDQPGDQRLVAYLTHKIDFALVADDSSILDTETVDEWQQLYNETYTLDSNTDIDPLFNIAGWNSSYTDQPIPAEQMRLWVETTVDRILALRPRRVLEIGCGTGLLLSRIVPHCNHYTGMDFSATVLKHLKENLHALEEHAQKVNLIQGPANCLNVLEGQQFDTVILNSVIQYFPSIEYFVGVLSQVTDILAPGGNIFVGDVRHLGLLEAFHTAVYVAHNPDEKPSLQIHNRIRDQMDNDKELVIDPRFFKAFQQDTAKLHHVEVLPKRGTYHNELSQYRYDVVFHSNSKREFYSPTSWIAWDETQWTLAQMQAYLQTHQPSELAFKEVVNSRVLDDINTWKTCIEHYDTHQEDFYQSGIDPELLWEMADQLSYLIELSWCSGDSDGRFDVVFRRRVSSSESQRLLCAFPNYAEELSQDRWKALANIPQLPKLRRDLLIQLQESLPKQLPSYMVPAGFVFLNTLPLTQNGKLDRKALPVPERLYSEHDYVPPRTTTEQTIAEIWRIVLGINNIAIHDNFFNLGGHSLLATQVVSRIRKTFNVELPISELFAHPLLSDLAAQVEVTRLTSPDHVAPPIVPVSRDGEIPLSFAQQRLWFLDQLIPDNPFYNMATAVRLRGAINITALQDTFCAVVARHEALRTVFVSHDGQPQQVIQTNFKVALPLIDLSALSESDGEAHMLALATHEAQTPFNLALGPLIRISLICLDTDHHVLLLNTHHSVSDGWSMGVLIHELADIYSAFSQGQPNPLPPLTVQYADFSYWQRHWLQGEVQGQQLGYWQRQLSGAPALLELPSDGSRPPVQSFRGAIQKFHLSAACTEQLKELSRKQGVTLFMTLMTTLQILLSKLSGQQDICVGTPIANRHHAELEPLIGFFVNTLVIRTQIMANSVFAEILSKVRNTTLEAYAHQDLPFEQLIDELNLPRNLSHAALFQVLFTLQNTPRSTLQTSDLQLEPVDIPNSTVKFDLELQLTETAEGLVGGWVYATDLFNANTIARWSQSFTQLLEQLVEQPDVRLNELQWLSNGERQQLLNDWGVATASYPAALTLHQRFEQQAYSSPNAVAAVYENQSLSYAELNCRANQLAHYLRAHGVAPDTLVGLCVERSLDIVVAILAILKAGGAYVPLDPDLPVERLRFILNDTSTPILLTQRSQQEALPDTDATTIYIDSQWDDIEQQPQTNPVPISLSAHLAYAIYTSGSTGQPKGVLSTHANVSRLFDATTTQFGFTQHDVWTLFHSYAFDFSVWELWGALLFGGKLVIVPWETSRDPQSFYSLLKAHKVTVLNQTPSAFAQLLACEHFTNGEAELAVRHIVFGGEALDLQHLRPWYARYANQTQLVNMYGITETTVHVTYCPLSNETFDAHISKSPIGEKIGDLQTYILDEYLHPVPVGVPGELYVGGAGLARGYLNRPALSAERFIPHPFSTQPGARLYKTGDRVRYLSNGCLDYLGRLDTQIKLRGFRIELGEIEAALRQHAAVKDAVVMLREEQPGNEQLAAYWVGQSDVNLPQPTDLRLFLRDHLPEYMIPVTYVALETLPLTPNGKLNHNALPIPDAPNTGQEYVPPSTQTETTLTQIWSDVLKLEKVGIQDNFFELGGNSLTAIQVLSRIKAIFSIDVPIRSMFESQTIESIAERIDALQSKTSELLSNQFEIMTQIEKLNQLSDAEISELLSKKKVDR